MDNLKYFGLKFDKDHDPRSAGDLEVLGQLRKEPYEQEQPRRGGAIGTLRAPFRLQGELQGRGEALLGRGGRTRPLQPLQSSASG